MIKSQRFPLLFAEQALTNPMHGGGRNFYDEKWIENWFPEINIVFIIAIYVGNIYYHFIMSIHWVSYNLHMTKLFEIAPFN